ncbi:MAG: hypothetical protein L0Y71_08685 [Gemmataceae bacterium]|nr:hypothetical protein [Gemmataceae bacterium]
MAKLFPNVSRLKSFLECGYESLDPSHPLGGKDGGKDATCMRDGQPWIMAVYFPRGQQEFATIKQKFLGDLGGVSKNAVIGIAFVTNQELRLAERTELTSVAAPIQVDLFHVERITTVLDKPNMAAIRKQFLSIDGDEAGVVRGADGGNIIIKVGDGGSVTGGGRGADGGSIIIKAGDGGNAIGGGRGADGGNITIKAGDGQSGG